MKRKLPLSLVLAFATSVQAATLFHDPAGPKFQYDRNRQACVDASGAPGLNGNYIGQCANLNQADLAGRDLRGMSFLGADLSEARLKGADFSGADLRAAKLQYTNWNEAIFKNAYYNKSSVLPFPPEQMGMLRLEYTELDRRLNALVTNWMRGGSPGSPVPGDVAQYIALGGDYLQLDGQLLFLALEKRGYAFFDLLFSRGLSPNLPVGATGYTRTLLTSSLHSHRSFQDRAVEIASYLLAKGANPNQADDQGETPLGLAITHGNPALVELLLNSGSDVNQFHYGSSPLALALRAQNTSLSLELVRRGADVNRCSAKADCSVLELAFRGDLAHGELLRTLLDKGADASKAFQAPSLLDYSNDPAVLGELLSHGAPAESATIWNRKSRDVISLLVGKGARIDDQNPADGRSYLLSAVLAARWDDVDFALSLKANPSVTDKNEYSAVSYILSKPENARRYLQKFLTLGGNPNVSVPTKDRWDRPQKVPAMKLASTEFEWLEFFMPLVQAGGDQNLYFVHNGSSFSPFSSFFLKWRQRSVITPAMDADLKTLLAAGADFRKSGPGSYPFHRMSLEVSRSGGLSFSTGPWGSEAFGDRSLVGQMFSYDPYGSEANAHFLRWLEKHGANLHDPVDGLGNHLVHLARTEEQLRWLHDNGFAMGARNSLGQNALFTVPNAPLISALLDFGVDVPARDSLGSSPLLFTPLRCPIGKNDNSIYARLIKAGADGRVLDQNTNFRLSHQILRHWGDGRWNSDCLADLWKEFRPFALDLNENWKALHKKNGGEQWVTGYGLVGAVLLMPMGLGPWSQKTRDRDKSLATFVSSRIKEGYQPLLEEQKRDPKLFVPLLDAVAEKGAIHLGRVLRAHGLRQTPYSFRKKAKSTPPNACAYFKGRPGYQAGDGGCISPTGAVWSIPRKLSDFPSFKEAALHCQYLEQGGIRWAEPNWWYPLAAEAIEGAQNSVPVVVRWDEVNANSTFIDIETYSTDSGKLDKVRRDRWSRDPVYVMCVAASW